MALKEERHNNMESDAICPQIPIQCLFSALKVKSYIIITKRARQVCITLFKRKSDGETSHGFLKR